MEESPAKQRIKDTEEGIQDSEETKSLILKIISSAIEEILAIFPHINTLDKYVNMKNMEY